MAVLAGLDGSNVTFRRPESPARGHPGPDRRPWHGGAGGPGRDGQRRHRRRLCTDCRVRPPVPGPWWGTV